MELQLGLTLSSYTPSKAFDFDLNKHWAVGRVGPCLDAEKRCSGKRRRFNKAFGNTDEEGAVPELRLVSWDRQPNEEDDPEEHNGKRDSATIYEYKEEENHEVVGWPPIKSWRRKYEHHRHRHYYRDGWIMVRNNRNLNRTTTIERDGSSSSSPPAPAPPSSSSPSPSSTSKSMYVKVKMEGVAIARKVDVKLFNSYEFLTHSLITMFAHYKGCKEDDTNYILTYQGKGGDWQLAADVPWKTFIETVHRMEIIRNHQCES